MEPLDLATLPPELAPEPPPKGPWVWARDNLFSTPFNTVLSLLAVIVVAAAIRGIVGWVFGTGRGWEAVATNMRLYMTQAYPESQFVRVWVSVGIIMTLAGLSMALWKVGSQVSIDRVTKAAQGAGVFVMLVVFLGPPNVDLDAGGVFDAARVIGIVLVLIAVVAAVVAFVIYLFTRRRHEAWQPVIIGLLGVALGLFFLEFLLEAVIMEGGRIAVFAVALAVFGAAYLVRRSVGDRAKEITFHSMYLVAAAAVSVALFAVFWPLGRYTFTEGEVRFETGPISDSTRWPIVRMVVVLAVAYGVGYLALKVLPEKAHKALQRLTLLGWGLALPIIILIVLRDPDFTARDAEGVPTGGFLGLDSVASLDVGLFVFFALIGGAVIGILSLPKLGELGRAISAGILIVALATVIGDIEYSLPSWLPLFGSDNVRIPNPVRWIGQTELVRVKILALLGAMFAIGGPTFAGDRRSRIRYLGLWAGVVGLALYLLAAINTESTLIIQGKTFLGGLTLTFVLALTSILLSFPIGVLMALGRTSTMPIFRIMSTVYIEMVRGIPFITVLIFFDLILVLFLPPELEFDSVTLAILAGTLFSAAYLAENVRGGLQAIPKGQYEAARAMGLSTLQLTVFIVLPQALRAVIPALVGQTIAIFKDTSLVAIIGLFDFLYIADKVVPNQTVFLGIRLENLLFIAGGYWIFTFAFSRASLRIEKKVGLGER